MVGFIFVVLSTLCLSGCFAQTGTLNSERRPTIQYRVEKVQEKLNATRIVYPSEDTNQNRRPIHNRPPIEDARICSDAELLYPGDNEGDWVCDCKPGYLHYPLTGRCYEAFAQGPCKHDQILMLFNTSSIPECVKNRCENGKVFFNDSCYPINSDEGCKQFEKFIGRKVLLVPDPTTLNLICADEDFKYACVNSCCVGSRRDYLKEHRICSSPRNSKKNSVQGQ